MLTRPKNGCQQSNVRLNHEMEAARGRLSERDRDVRDLQSALKNLEHDKRRIGDDHMDNTRSLRLEMDRVRRDMAKNEQELDQARQEIQIMDKTIAEQRNDILELVSTDPS